MIDTNESALRLEKVKRTELIELADMASQIWDDHYTSIIGREQINYMLEKFYSEDALLRQQDEGQEFLFIVQDTDRLGFLAYTMKEPCECFINKLYLLTNKQSKNIGTKVIEIVKSEFRSDKCEKMTYKLTVNRQNHKAINFYFKNGFKIESIADFDIGNGYFMNDFILSMSC